MSPEWLPRGPWKSKNMEVVGEEELGTQRICSRCHEPWPLDGDFYWRRGKGWQSWCIACHLEHNGESTWDRWKRRREQMRANSAAYRARKRAVT